MKENSQLDFFGKIHELAEICKLDDRDELIIADRYPPFAAGVLGLGKWGIPDPKQASDSLTSFVAGYQLGKCRGNRP